MAGSNPYAGLAPSKWKARTEKLIAEHPLDTDELKDVVLLCWDSIFNSRLGTRKYRIGEDIFPKPQIMGFLLEELIALELADRHPKKWRAVAGTSDKDLVCVADDTFSIEVKTSSHASQVFGNRSYAQPSPRSKKAKAGYYLTVNFEKFNAGGARPSIVGIRFGWIDHSDWVAQKSATGQQARLLPEVYGNKLLQLFPAAAKS